MIFEILGLELVEIKKKIIKIRWVEGFLWYGKVFRPGVWSYTLFLRIRFTLFQKQGRHYQILLKFFMVLNIVTKNKSCDFERNSRIVLIQVLSRHQVYKGSQIFLHGLKILSGKFSSEKQNSSLYSDFSSIVWRAYCIIWDWAFLVKNTIRKRGTAIQGWNDVTCQTPYPY